MAEPQTTLHDQVMRLQKAGVDPEKIKAFIVQWGQEQRAAPPAAAQPPGQPLGPNPLYGIRWVPQEEWDKLTLGEKFKGAVEAGGRMMGNTWFGPQETDFAFTYPKTFLATGAIPHGRKLLEGLRRLGGISSQRAAANMRAVSQRMQGQSVPTASLQEPLAEYQQLAQWGRGARAANRLATKTSEGQPLDWGEAEKAISALSRLSANEFNNLNPQMQRQVIIVRDALRSAMADTATTKWGSQGRLGDQYMKGVREYARAKRAEDVADTAKQAALKFGVPMSGVGAGGGFLAWLLGDK